MRAGWLFLKATFFKLLQSCRKLIGPLNKGYVGNEEVVLVVKNLSANAEDIRDVGSGGLQSMGSLRVGHN